MSALSSKSKIRYFIWPTLLHRLSTAPSIHPESCPATRWKWMLHRLSTAPSICPESCPATRLKWMLHRFSTAPSIRPESCPETPMTWMMNRLSTASSTHPEPPPDPALEWMKVLFHKTITRYIDNWYNLPIKVLSPCTTWNAVQLSDNAKATRVEQTTTLSLWWSLYIQYITFYVIFQSTWLTGGVTGSSPDRKHIPVMETEEAAFGNCTRWILDLVPFWKLQWAII